MIFRHFPICLIFYLPRATDTSCTPVFENRPHPGVASPERKSRTANTPSQTLANDPVPPVPVSGLCSKWYREPSLKRPANGIMKHSDTPAASFLHHCVPLWCTVTHENASASHKCRIDLLLLLLLLGSSRGRLLLLWYSVCVGHQVRHTHGPHGVRRVHSRALNIRIPRIL